MLPSPSEVPHDDFHGHIEVTLAGRFEIERDFPPEGRQVFPNRVGTIHTDPRRPRGSIHLAVEFVKGAAGPSQSLCVVDLESPQVEAQLSGFAATAFDCDVQSPSGLELLAGHVSPAGQDLPHLEEGGSHNFVREAPVAHLFAGGIGENHLGVDVHSTQFVLRLARGGGVEIKDTDFEVERDSELVSFDVNGAAPGGIQVVEDSVRVR